MQGMQNACDEREKRKSCLVCLRCLAQGGLQRFQRDACCRRLWSSVNYAALPYLLELHVRRDSYRSQCTHHPPLPTWASDDSVVYPTISIALSDFTSSTSVCLYTLFISAVQAVCQRNVQTVIC